MTNCVLNERKNGAMARSALNRTSWEAVSRFLHLRLRFLLLHSLIIPATLLLSAGMRVLDDARGSYGGMRGCSYCDGREGQMTGAFHAIFFITVVESMYCRRVYITYIEPPLTND